MPDSKWLEIPEIKPIYAYDPIYKKKKWMRQLLEDFKFTIFKKTFIIPKGFIMDGASIPKCLRWFACPMDLPALMAALVHDYLYITWEVSKEEADRIFKTILIFVWVPDIKVSLYYRAVKYWGWRSRNNYRNYEKKHWKACKKQ